MAGTITLPRPHVRGRAERPPDPVPAGPGGPRPGPDRRFWAVVALALVLGCGLRAAIGATDDSPATDETAYLAAGESLVAGDGFARDGHPELHFPPLIPFLLGQGGRVFADPHTGAVVLTWLAGTALIVPLARPPRPRPGARAARPPTPCWWSRPRGGRCRPPTGPGRPASCGPRRRARAWPWPTWPGPRACCWRRRWGSGWRWLRSGVPHHPDRA